MRRLLFWIVIWFAACSLSSSTSGQQTPARSASVAPLLLVLGGEDRASVVGNGNDRRGSVVALADAQRRRPRMADRVRHRFLHDAEERHAFVGRRLFIESLHDDFAAHAGAVLHVLREPLDRGA